MSYKFKNLRAVAAALLLAGLAGGATAQTSEEAQPEVPAEDVLPEDLPRYTLNPGDRIEISVLEDPSLNRNVLILPDGRISMPIAGTIIASNRTPEQVAAEVTRRLASIFVSPPTVTVSAVGVGLAGEELVPPELVYVLGEVRSPGAVPIVAPVTVIQTLALVGGPSPFAARSRIQIHREVEGVKTVEIFDYEAVEKGRSAEMGPILVDGDVIIVPERSLFD